MRSQVVLAVLCAFFGVEALAQSTSARIVGTVIDAAGAAVGSAEVVGSNEATGFTRAAKTTEAGDYVLVDMPVGRYKIRIAAPGFRGEEIRGIDLNVDQTVRVDARLQIGTVSESVEVTATAPIVQSDTSAVGSVISHRDIVQLPLNGRQFSQLATLAPGVISAGTGGFSGTPQVSVNGARGTKTEFLVDGLTTSELVSGGSTFSPTLDSLAEFKLQAANFSAEFGRGPSSLNVVTRSGANKLHASLWEFVRNDKFDARNFFSLTSPPPLKQNQFGAAVGGPVIKNRTFFFVTYEGLRLTNGLINNIVVAPAAWRTGDFSSLLPRTTIKDPLTGQVFAGNVVPASRLDSASRYLNQFFPLANTAAGTYSAAPSATARQDQGNLRIDHRFSNRDTIYGRMSINDYDLFTPGPYPNNAGAGDQPRKATQFLVSETHVLSPTTVTELRLGISRFQFLEFQDLGTDTNYTVAAGIRGFDVQSATVPGFPNIGITGYGGINGLVSYPLRNVPTNYQITDSVTMIRGSHTIKAGMDWRRYVNVSSNAASARGQFSFDGSYTGNGYADFMLGYPSSATRSFPRNTVAAIWNNLHQYVQDDWRVSRTLTINAGLRYELNMVPWRKDAAMSTYAPQLGKVVYATLPNGQFNLTSQQISAAAYAAFKDYIISPKQAGYPQNLRYPDHNDWAPRLGLAWRPFGDNKTVVRASAGLFYIEKDQNTVGSQFAINPPIIVDETLANTKPVPTQTFRDYFPTTGGVFVAPQVYALNPYQRTGEMWQWSFFVQREVIRDLAVQIGYVGNNARHLEDDRLLNIPSPGPGSVQTRRPNPWFGPGFIREDGAFSHWNGLEMQAEKRFSHGVTFQANYTFSNAMSDCDSDGGDCYRDPSRRYLERARSNVDRPHRLIGNFVWEIPVGKNRRLLGNLPSWADQFIGGWQLGGIGTVQSGAPFTPNVSSDNLNAGLGNSRPNRIGSGAVDNPTIAQWFNPADFAVAPAYVFGNSGRNILRGPNLRNLDIAASKSFRIREQIRLQLRGEYFNLLNHPNFSNPVTTIGTTTVGRILSAGAARIGQIALRLEF